MCAGRDRFGGGRFWRLTTTSRKALPFIQNWVMWPALVATESGEESSLLSRGAVGKTKVNGVGVGVA